MSLSGLLDTRINVYRSPDVGDKYGDANSVPSALISAATRAGFHIPLRLHQSDQGPGGHPSGYLYMNMERKADIKSGDIVKYVSGTLPPSLLWIVLTVYRPKNKATQCVVGPYTGAPPT